MKKLFAMIMVMCLVMGLCACGGGDGKTDSTGDANTAKSIAGRYEIFSISFEDQVMNKDELTDREVDETVILKEDGTGTWIFSGDEITISYDEKTGIQAIACTSDERAPIPGTDKISIVQRDYEYKRLGTLSLLAEIDLLSGESIPYISETHKSSDFV